MNRPTLVVGLTIAALSLISYQWWASSHASQALSTTVNPPAKDTPRPQWPQTPADTPTTPAGDSPLLPTDSYRDASQSLRDTYAQGDSRMPPIERSPEAESPTEAELSSPEQYKQYETRQTRRIYQAYLKATDSELPLMQQQLEQGKQSGVAPAEIAKMEEKIRRMSDMRQQVQQTLAQP